METGHPSTRPSTRVVKTGLYSTGYAWMYFSGKVCIGPVKNLLVCGCDLHSRSRIFFHFLLHYEVTPEGWLPRDRDQLPLHCCLFLYVPCLHYLLLFLCKKLTFCVLLAVKGVEWFVAHCWWHSRVTSTVGYIWWPRQRPTICIWQVI